MKLIQSLPPFRRSSYIGQKSRNIRWSGVAVEVENKWKRKTTRFRNPTGRWRFSRLHTWGWSRSTRTTRNNLATVYVKTQTYQANRHSPLTIISNALLRNARKPHRDMKRHRQSLEDLRKMPAPPWTRRTKKIEVPPARCHISSAQGIQYRCRHSNIDMLAFRWGFRICPTFCRCEKIESFFFESKWPLPCARRPSGDIGWEGPTQSKRKLLQKDSVSTMWKLKNWRKRLKWIQLI